MLSYDFNFVNNYLGNYFEFVTLNVIISILRYIMQRKITIFDGAMGTILYGKGIISECTEVINLNNPDIISDIHKSYAESGAMYVKTNTFGGSALKLMKSGNDSFAFEINYEAYQLARSSGAKVAGDIGPSGEIYSPYGSVSTLDIYNSFLIQVLALKDSDMFLIETMSSLVEANLAYLAIRSINREVPVIISFTYDKGYTMMGCSPELIAKATNALDIYAIGTNCSGGPVELLDVVKSYKANSIHKISAMPNAGLPVLKGDNIEYPFKVSDFKAAMIEIVNAGADIIGGCCGTTPEHIKAIKDIESNSEDIVNDDKTIYIATESKFRDTLDAITCLPNDDEILKIEDEGKIARIDVRGIIELEEYFNNLNQLSPVPKCFIGREEQELLIRILYQGITDVKIEQ